MLMIFHFLERNSPKKKNSFLFEIYDCPRYFNQFYEVTQLLYVNVVGLSRGVKIEGYMGVAG